ncbi:MAG: DNA adenine methylase [Deltaproteobacteria bacterium]|nr:DNA adenine methylase [Deltaproteobacteria bacterium]
MSFVLTPPGPRPRSIFPSTRYLGSKRKLLGLLEGVLGRLAFDTALDAFSGTGAVAYLMKSMGKAVTANDALAANAVAARALVANQSEALGSKAQDLVSGLPRGNEAPGFVETEFDGIFFERDENRFLDQILPRVHALGGAQRDLALLALCGACLAKRPYNLFHRANLAMRRRDVPRSFGNKTTWDTPFAELFARYAAENDAAVFDSGRACQALRGDVLALDPSGYDLVYLDPPYVSARGAGVDYLDYYHFLEGLCEPEGWGGRILRRYKHKPLEGRGASPWCDPCRIVAEFARAVAHFSRSTLVVSYRSDGIPSLDAIAGFLKAAGKRVEVVDAGSYTYALSRNRASREVVLVGT